MEKEKTYDEIYDNDGYPIEDKYKGNRYDDYYVNSFSSGYRKHIYNLCKNECFYCHIKLEDMDVPTIDHVTAQINGGGDQEWNLVLACKSCNCRKGKKDFAWFLQLEEIRQSEDYKNYLIKAEYYKKLFADLKAEYE